MMQEEQPLQPDTGFETLLRPLLGPAYGFALQMTRNEADAEDLLQEAVLLALRSFSGFRRDAPFKPWFFTLLTNCFRMKYRKLKREPEQVRLEETEEPDLFLYQQTRKAGWHKRKSDPAALFLSRLEARDIAAALQSLPEDYRLIASLYFVGEFSYEEIAEMVDCPLGTVRSRLHRGRKQLQQRLWQLAEEQGIASPPQRKGER